MSWRVLLQRFSAFKVALLIVAIATCGYAQSGQAHRFTFNVGGGVTPLTGQLSTRLDNGWHVTFGGGYNFSSRFSTGIQFMYNGLGVGSAVLREAAVPDGDAHVWALTLEPRVNLSPEHTVNPYLVGGVGYYRRVVNFTAPTIAPVFIFDPFFGLVSGFVPANQLLRSIRRNGVGGSAGLGFDFNVARFNGVKIFTEARYHYADTGGIPTRMVPVTFGIRW